MRFMIIVKATPDSEAGVMPEEGLMAAMATYHEELVRAGVLLDAAGLKPSAKGWRVRYRANQRSVIEGPFAESTRQPFALGFRPAASSNTPALTSSSW